MKSSNEEAVEKSEIYYTYADEKETVKLSGRSFSTQKVGKYTFFAIYSKGVKSKSLQVEFTQSALTLQADKNSITADNAEEITFSVYQDDEKQTNGYKIKVKQPSSSTFVSHTSNKFKTNQAGNYAFIVEKDGLTSSEIHVEVLAKTETPAANQKPVLTVSKSTITANDEDKTIFTITLNGADVTANYDIYRVGQLNSEVQLRDNTFKISTEGNYTFFAQEKVASSGTEKQRTQNISVIAQKPTGNDPNARVFVKGVTLESGWHDVNKFFGERKGDKGGDGVLCWAASSSNMIQWWLEDYKAKGYKIPEGMPFGKGKNYELAIFEEYMKYWQNIQAVAYPGVQFFFVGTDLTSHTKEYLLKTEYRSFEGFFKRSSEWDNVKAFFSTYGHANQNSYVKDYGSYSTWRYKGGINAFTELIVRLLNEGDVSLTVGGHEVSVWGVDLKNGVADYIYITNSDDKTRHLDKIKLQVVGGDVYLDRVIQGAAGNHTNGNGKRIDALTGLKAYPKK